MRSGKLHQRFQVLHPRVEGAGLFLAPIPARRKKEFSGYDCCFPGTGRLNPSCPAPAMLIDRYADDAVVWAPAKINLFLEILGKRPDGYHEIATLMVAIRLYDTLVFKEDPAGAISLTCNQSKLSTGPDN